MSAARRFLGGAGFLPKLERRSQLSRSALQLLESAPAKVERPVEVDEHTTTAVESEALGRLAQLPPFSPVALSLLRSFDRSDVEVQEIAKLVGSDAALSAEILACANSPLFGLQLTVIDLRHAITVLGNDQIRNLTTTLAMRALLKAAPKPAVVRRLWRHNIATAAVASELAGAFGVAAELAGTAGILHDVGRIGLLSAFRDDYPGLVVRQHDSVQAILDAETDLCSTDHCQAGLFLSKAWGFPEVFQEVIAQHHGSPTETGLLALLQTSCLLADDLGFAAVANASRADVMARLEERLPGGLSDAVKERWPKVEERIFERIERLDM